MNLGWAQPARTQPAQACFEYPMANMLHAQLSVSAHWQCATSCLLVGPRAQIFLCAPSPLRHATERAPVCISLALSMQQKSATHAQPAQLDNGARQVACVRRVKAGGPVQLPRGRTESRRLGGAHASRAPGAMERPAFTGLPLAVRWVLFVTTIGPRAQEGTRRREDSEVMTGAASPALCACEQLLSWARIVVLSREQAI